MSSDQPDALAVVHVVVADLHGDPAYGYTDAKGEPVVCADRAILSNDPAARESAFRVFVEQVAAQVGRPNDPRERTPRQRTAADRCASWPRRTQPVL